MDIWQRGTSVTVSSFTYTSDRWQVYRAVAGATVTRQATGDTTNLPNIQYCMRVSRDSGNTSTSSIFFAQSVETANSIPYAGKAVTFSFYARKGANYSPTSSAFTGVLNTGTGTDQNNLSSGFTGGATAITINATLTTTWQRFTGTATLASSTTEIAAYFTINPTGTAGAADYVEITGVQVELGSTATTFSRAGGTIQGELAACQRYYYKYLTGTSQAIGVVTFFAATQVETAIQFPVTMRIAPTLVVSAGAAYYSARRVAQSTTTLTILLPSTSGTMLYGGSFVGLTAGQSDILNTNNASSSIAFNSEL
jgi:hypothetical protein